MHNFSESLDELDPGRVDRWTVLACRVVPNEDGHQRQPVSPRLKRSSVVDFDQPLDLLHAGTDPLARWPHHLRLVLLFHLPDAIRYGLAELLRLFEQHLEVRGLPVDLRADDLDDVVFVGGPLKGSLHTRLIQISAQDFAENLQKFFFCELLDIEVCSCRLRAEAQFLTMLIHLKGSSFGVATLFRR